MMIGAGVSLKPGSESPPAKWNLGKQFEGTRKSIPALEGLRGIAIALVFLVHYYHLCSPQLLPNAGISLAAWMSAAGHSGVDLFFILSGYLIYGASLKPKLNILSFWRRRLQRIYPTFLAVAAIYLVLIACTGIQKLPATFAENLSYFAANLLLLIGFIKTVPALITVSWSMSYEVAYYLAAPVLAVYLRLHSWRRSRRIWAIVAFTSGWLLLCAAGISEHSRLAMFPAGMLLFELSAAGYRPRQTAWIRAGILILFGLGIVSSAAFANPVLRQLGALEGSVVDPVRVVILFVALSPLVYYALHDSTPLTRWLESAPLRYLGNISYSFYLMHSIAIHAVARCLARVPEVSGAWVYWLGLPLVFALAVAVSIPLYLLIEKPFSLAPRDARVAVTASGG